MRLRGSAMRSILVVCHGNICRSPYLEAVLRRALPGLQVSSAGLIGPGRPVPAHGRNVASRSGLDLTSHRSRVLNADMLSRADMVIVMDPRQARYLTDSLRFPPDRLWIAGDLDAVTRAPRAITDPWDKPIEVFASSYERLDHCAATIVAILSTTVPTSVQEPVSPG
jgi:protein-tyrosine phosphatase